MNNICDCTSEKKCPEHTLAPYIPLQVTTIKWEDGRAVSVTQETYTPLEQEYTPVANRDALDYEDSDYDY